MPRFMRPKPVAACMECRAITDMHEQVNHRCDRLVNGRRCPGIYRSDLSLVWDKCQGCEATGYIGSQACVECAGMGWHLR
jgi:hypothetical protein